MFGFLRGSRCLRAYRQVYAECCRFQRQTFGLESLVFLSYEAVYLYVLAVDAGAAEPPPQSAVTCCRLRRRAGNWPSFDARLAQFCACFSLLLAAVKLDDDVRDDRSWLARLARRRFSRRFQLARHYFAGLDPHFEQRLNQFLARHLRLEQNAGQQLSLDDYLRPTAEAFGYFFALFGNSLPHPLRAAPALEQIGQHVGAAIIAYDCAVDFRRDRRRGIFNPLQQESDRGRALDAAQRHLALAGWECVGAFGGSAVGAQVARFNFDRVGTADLSEPRTRSRPRSGRKLRRGECDCLCDPSCCEGCAAGPCDGGESVGGLVDCCVCMPCDCCWWDCGTRRHQKTETSEPPKVSSIVGMTGRTVGPLNPSGMVMISGKQVPARSDGEWIEGDTEIKVVAEQPFGALVRSLRSD